MRSYDPINLLIKTYDRNKKENVIIYSSGGSIRVVSQSNIMIWIQSQLLHKKEMEKRVKRKHKV